MHHDRVILGGLNENQWPPKTQSNPWLSRLMQAELSLPLPEKRVGQSAHDFTQGLGQSDVWLTRSKKLEGATYGSFKIFTAHACLFRRQNLHSFNAKKRNNA